MQVNSFLGALDEFSWVFSKIYVTSAFSGFFFRKKSQFLTVHNQSVGFLINFTKQSDGLLLCKKIEFTPCVDGGKLSGF